MRSKSLSILGLAAVLAVAAAATSVNQRQSRHALPQTRDHAADDHQRQHGSVVHARRPPWHWVYDAAAVAITGFRRP